MGCNHFLIHLDEKILFQPTNNIELLSLNTDENNIQEPIIIYPNPAKIVLYFEGLKDNSKIIIYNIEGKILIENDLNADYMDINNLPIGFYIVKIINANGIIIGKFEKL